MKHIRQIGADPYTVVITNCSDEELINHISITDYPELFEIAECEIASNAQYLNAILKTKLEVETDNYLKRINDGTNQVAKFSAELRLQKMSGAINEETQKVIDNALIEVRTEVMAGQWISAKDKLITLGTSVIGVDLYNYVMSKLDNYINDNY